MFRALVVITGFLKILEVIFDFHGRVEIRLLGFLLGVLDSITELRECLVLEEELEVIIEVWSVAMLAGVLGGNFHPGLGLGLGLGLGWREVGRFFMGGG